jgi:cobyrinic acid a,c-diamide synthase
MVVVAGAAAFTFGYTEQVELLETAGLDVASLAGQSRLFVVWGEHS